MEFSHQKLAILTVKLDEAGNPHFARRRMVLVS